MTDDDNVHGLSKCHSVAYGRLANLQFSSRADGSVEFPSPDGSKDKNYEIVDASGGNHATSSGSHIYVIKAGSGYYDNLHN